MGRHAQSLQKHTVEACNAGERRDRASTGRVYDETGLASCSSGSGGAKPAQSFESSKAYLI